MEQIDFQFSWNPWNSMDIKGHSQMSVHIHGRQTSIDFHLTASWIPAGGLPSLPRLLDPPMNFQRNLRIHMEIHGYPLKSMYIHGSAWASISMDIHGYLWKSMDIHGYPWESMEIRRFAQIFSHTCEKQLFTFLACYPLICEFEALSRLAIDRSRRDLAVGVKNSSFHSMAACYWDVFLFSIDFRQMLYTFQIDASQIDFRQMLDFRQILITV